VSTNVLRALLVVVIASGPVYRMYRARLRQRLFAEPKDDSPEAVAARRAAVLAVVRREAFTVRSGRLTMTSRSKPSLCFTAAGLEVHERGTFLLLRWEDHVLPSPPPLGHGWCMTWTPGSHYHAPKVNVRYAAATSAAGGTSTDRIVSLVKRLGPTEREVLLALPRVLRARAELRAALDDETTVIRLAEEIASWHPSLRPHELGSVRRETVDVQTAMRTCGYAHPFGRRVPGDPIPTADEALAAVRGVLQANPYARPGHLDDHELLHIIRRDFLAIEPFPFAALADFARDSG
jgi:hypothetical protein